MSIYKFPVLTAPGSDLVEKAAAIRTAYQTQFGVQAPPFDPERRPKYWIDPAAEKLDPAAKLTYAILGNTGPREIEMTAREAATVNLPGAYRYEPWRGQPTASRIGGIPVAPSEITTPAEAEALRAEIGGDAVVASESNAEWDPADNRRYHQIRWRGQLLGAANLRELKNARGVGAPGKWDLTGAEPRWVSAVDGQHGVYDMRGNVPVPVRELGPEEEWQKDGFLGGWKIVKKQPPVVPPPTSGASPDVAELKAFMESFRAEVLSAFVRLRADIHGE